MTNQLQVNRDPETVVKWTAPHELHRSPGMAGSRGEVPRRDVSTEEWLKGNAAYLSALTKPAGEA